MSGKIWETVKGVFSNRDTLTTTGLNNFILGYLQQHAADIGSASRATGVQASAICAAIAEEMRNVYPNENGDKRSPDEYGDNRVLGYPGASLPSLWNEYQAKAVIEPGRKIFGIEALSRRPIRLRTILVRPILILVLLSKRLLNISPIKLSCLTR